MACNIVVFQMQTRVCSLFYKCFLVWPRKQIASAKLFSMMQVCWKTLGVASNAIPWWHFNTKTFHHWCAEMSYPTWSRGARHCTTTGGAMYKKKTFQHLSAVMKICISFPTHLYIKPFARGYLSTCITILNTIGLVVCEDIIVCTPSLCTTVLQITVWFVGLALVT